jgi:hypothetical protein
MNISAANETTSSSLEEGKQPTAAALVGSTEKVEI